MNSKSKFFIIVFLTVFTSIFLTNRPINSQNINIGDPVIFYLSPDGSDNNDGKTREKPLKSIMKARNAARAIRFDTHKKIVLLGGKYYEFDLYLEQVDTGLTIESASGEKVVLYGGRRITNWVKEGKFFTAHLDGVKDRTWDFHMIEVNGKIRPRARLPKTGRYEHLSRFDVKWMSSTGGGWERKPTVEELSTMKYKKGDLGSWIDLNNAELTIFHNWDESLVGLKSIDEKTQTVKFSIPAGHPTGAFYVSIGAGGFKSSVPHADDYIVWNIREGMNEPGQWYLNRTDEKLVYWPLPGEDISTLNVVVPTKENIIRLRGVRDVTFKDITISCTTTPFVSGGYGAARFDGAISGSGDNCSFINITICNVAGQGFKISGDSNRIENCEIYDVGASGIRSSGSNCIVYNNYVHDIGIIYPSAIAMSVNGNGTVISHNEVHNAPYGGIYSGKSIVEYNLVYDVMKVLLDGSCFNGGSIVRHNIAKGGRDEKSLAIAYYHDEQSTGYLVEENIAINTYRPIHNHMTKNGIIRNNVFIDSGPQVLRFSRVYGVTFEKNILIADDITFHIPQGGVIDYQMFWEANGISSMQKNIIFSRKNKANVAKIDYYIIKEVIPLEQNEGNILTDPLISGWESGVIRFDPGSPAYTLGIKPIDLRLAGRIRKQ